MKMLLEILLTVSEMHQKVFQCDVWNSHCTLVPENCQKIAGVPSVWTQTRPGINSGIDPGLGPSNIAGFSSGTSAVWTKAGSMP